MQHTFHTPEPTSLYVELGSGDLDVRAEDVTETTVEVHGRNAEDVTVEQRDDQVVVLAPRRGGNIFGGGQDLRVRVSMPAGSRFATKVGSADVRASGRLGETMVKSGSGDIEVDEVEGGALLETGSGDLEIGTVSGELQIKSGSGDVAVDRAEGRSQISTGSGDVEVGLAANLVQVKSGSGDGHIREARDAVSVTTASGDLSIDTMHRGELRANNVSGDIRVGIPAGVPVWTEISSVTGSVHSDLDGVGEPAEGQDYVTLRAKTVSGDIYLEQR